MLLTEQQKWWHSLIDQDCLPHLQPSTNLRSASRQASRALYREELALEDYIHVSTTLWMVDLLEQHSHVTAQDLWLAVRRVFQSTGESSSDATSSLPDWILPSLDERDWESMTVHAECETEEQRRLLILTRLVHFWKHLYRRFVVEEETPLRKRRKLERQYLCQGTYQLRMAYVVASLLQETSHSWQVLHVQLHHHARHFQTWTNNDVRAGMALLALKLTFQNKTMEGLTPTLLLQDYIGRTG